MNTYQWQISQLDCYPLQDENANVVFLIHWRRQATDGIHYADMCGTQSVTLDPDAPFTPYADLTKAQIIGWLESAIGSEELTAQEAVLDKRIEDQINPPISRPLLPWAAE